jgi:RiboL-PSP-HEPN
MAASKRFQRLVTRLAVLEKHLLPKQFSPTGHYSSKEVDLARAYVLLTHAEIEAYIEDRADSKVARAYEAWQNRQVCSSLLSRVVIYYQARAKSWDVTGIHRVNVDKARNFYVNELRENHGIKEKNLLSIFLPLGLEHSDFDTSLLATLNNFGVLRGKLAHESIKTHQPIDPKNERDKIQKHILPELRKLDIKISRLY